MLDATPIIPRLYQGSRPPQRSRELAERFDVVVLAARGYQPETEAFPGLVVVRAPIADAVLTPREFDLASQAARLVASAHQHGGRVLVTCEMGLNRSGLVTALALRLLAGVSGAEAAAFVQERRPRALFNPTFVAKLRSLPARRL